MFGFNPEKENNPLSKIKNVAKAVAAVTTGAFILNQGQAKAQEKDLPTRQDSLDLYENSVAQDKFYSSNKDYQRYSEEEALEKLGFVLPSPFVEKEASKKSGRTLPANFESVHSKQIFDHQKKVENNILNKNPSDYKNNNDPAAVDKGYEKLKKMSKDPNHSWVPDLVPDSLADFDNPGSLIDRRISPDFYEYYTNENRQSDMYQDATVIYKYDPLKVKPYDLLTAEEKELRKQIYGVKGFPEDSNKSSGSIDFITEETPVTAEGSDGGEDEKTKIENKETPRDALIFRADVPNWLGDKYDKKKTPKGGLCFYYDKIGNVHVITREEFKRRKKLIEEQGEKATTKVLIDLPEDKEE